MYTDCYVIVYSNGADLIFFPEAFGQQGPADRGVDQGDAVDNVLPPGGPLAFGTGTSPAVVSGRGRSGGDVLHRVRRVARKSVRSYSPMTIFLVHHGIARHHLLAPIFFLIPETVKLSKSYNCFDWILTF